MADGAPVIPRPLEMDRQPPRDLTGAPAIDGYSALGDPLVEPKPPGRGDPVVQDILVERMDEAVASRHRAVGQTSGARRP